MRSFILRMPLQRQGELVAYLLNKDYETLCDAGLEYEETEISTEHILIIKNYPLPDGAFVESGKPDQGVLTHVDVLTIIPPTYNSGKLDMFWFNPALSRVDGAAIDRAEVYGNPHSKHHNGKEYCRWSRHDSNNPWHPREDDIRTWLNRLEWALNHTDCKR